jgi:hypothetical protein
MWFKISEGLEVSAETVLAFSLGRKDSRKMLFELFLLKQFIT